MKIGRGMATLIALALTGCGKADDAQPADSPSLSVTVAAATTPGAQPAAFAQCVACHSLEPGKNGIGPSLHGVVGRKAGSLAGFAYSTPLKNSGLTWDTTSLDTWIGSPVTAVPGNKMTYAGLRDPARRAEVIAYLETLK